MSELRQNKVTRQWTIFAPERVGRPRDVLRCAGPAGPSPVIDPRCPFCPGDEQMVLSLILELPDGHGGWRTRVAPNKYPILTPDAGELASDQGVYVTRPGQGRHEVIIETPRHNEDLAFMAGEGARAVIETYHRRYVDLSREGNPAMTFIFRNHGPGAGTSLAHPHSQLVSTPIVPPRIRWQEEMAQQYFNDWGRCGYCDMLRIEERDRQRLVLENASFVAFVPFAAEAPCEIWIAPRRHQSDFGSLVDAEKADLAEALQGALYRLARKAGDPDYNCMIHTAAGQRPDAPYLHWYVQILPRLTCEAGFEVGSGIGVNLSLPEEDARLLR